LKDAEEEERLEDEAEAAELAARNGGGP